MSSSVGTGRPNLSSLGEEDDICEADLDDDEEVDTSSSSKNPADFDFLGFFVFFLEGTTLDLLAPNPPPPKCDVDVMIMGCR